MKILEVRPELVICDVDGVITTRPNSPYYSLKYFKYDSNRIAYTFSDRSFVQETYDARIFNCWCNGKRVQFRQDLSEKLAAAINHHDMYGNVREYDELFKVAFEEEPNWYIIDRYLNNIEGVRRTKMGFIVYDSFKIDYKGNAWVHRKGEGAGPRWQGGISPEPDWNSLCIVMKGAKHSYEADKAFLPDEYGEMTEVNALTMTIIAKIVFLLNPNMKDLVFVGQLSEQLRIKLNALTTR